MNGTFQIDDHLRVAISACLDAGRAIMKVYKTDFAVEYKDDNSPITEADKEANTIINSYLKNTGIPIISEENKETHFKERKLWKDCWIVDPVDGTREFLKKNDEFTVNIALVREGVPEYGVIYAPAFKWLYFADMKQNKTFKVVLKTHQDSLETILLNKKELKPAKENKETIKVLASRSHLKKQTSDYIYNLKAHYKNVDVEQIGSSLKFCMIAEGKADVYPRFGNTMEWDTAAGQVICNAAGFEVLDIKSKKPLVYNKEVLINPFFIVTKTDNYFE